MLAFLYCSSLCKQHKNANIANFVFYGKTRLCHEIEMPFVLLIIGAYLFTLSRISISVVISYSVIMICVVWCLLCRTGETVCLNSDKSYAVSILYHDHLFIVKIMLFKLIQYWGPFTLNVNDCLER